jgi:hypothetical protein
MSTHDKLKAAGITPTTDVEKAYRMGLEDRRNFEGELNDDLLLIQDQLVDRVAVLEKRLTEIHLLSGRKR